MINQSTISLYWYLLLAWVTQAAMSLSLPAPVSVQRDNSQNIYTTEQEIRISSSFS
jgi:hypothetical protein